MIRSSVLAKQAREKQAFYEEAFKDGHKAGYNEGMVELHIFKESALRIGVARYEIVDPMTGETSFRWVTTNGVRELYLRDYPDAPLIEEVETYTESK